MTKTFARSQAMLQRALAVTPVGAQTYSKSYRYLAGPATPYFIERGAGARVWDLDGNEFADFVLGLGPITVGYNHPEVNEAIVRQLEKGIVFSQSTALEVELAEKLIEVIPCAEMVRFVKNGSDATTAAVRLARAYTGREVIGACGYHGMHDWYVGSTSLHQGVPAAVRALTDTFAYNDLASLEALFARHDGQVAGIILEPVQGEAPRDNFLHRVKELCARHGAVLIFDEVVSGFRVALGGGQEYYGVTPDLAAFGKGMANGLALSAVVGKREILRLIEDGVFISTTFGGEALALAGTLKAIEILQRPASLPHIWRLSTRLMEGTLELARQKQLLGTVVDPWGLPPHGGLAFRETGRLAPNDLLSVYQQCLLQEGILSLGINNFCLAHTDAQIDAHLHAVARALDDLAHAVANDSLDGIVSGNRIQPIFKRN